MNGDSPRLGRVPELAMAPAHGDDVPPLIVELFEDFADFRGHRCSKRPRFKRDDTSCCSLTLLLSGGPLEHLRPGERAIFCEHGEPTVIHVRSNG